MYVMFQSLNQLTFLGMNVSGKSLFWDIDTRKTQVYWFEITYTEKAKGWVKNQNSTHDDVSK